MVADAGHDVRDVVQVVVRQGVEQQAADDLDVAGQDAFDEGAAVGGDGDEGDAVVLGAGAAGDQAGLLQQARLVGQAAAAVDDAVGQLGHGQRAVEVGEAGQQLELDVADTALGPQLLLHLVLQQADGFGEHEVGAQLGRVEWRDALLTGGHPLTLPAANSQQCAAGHPHTHLLRTRSELSLSMCFNFEAHGQRHGERP
ncbi:hypothetical protein SBRY_50769 [Actinacidiphila bryophytorum]|uniref:Uncharacterized protein n=1 Tax=Actinacidiphila bryophytorum TaxID=1436133 RepID=A0A9W4H5H1_9ACTN|nr:hypothetical protein SBRY_50769 [Actinacidiphila bryophytorum]